MKLELAQEGVYTIDGHQLKLKEDYTIDESEKATKLLSLFFDNSEVKMTAVANPEDVKKFLAVVLEPVDGGELPDNINFGKTKESDLIKIVMFFFINKITKTMNSTSELLELMKKHLKV